MLKNVFDTFVKKALYAAAGNTLLAVCWGLKHYVPNGDGVDLQTYAVVSSVVIGGVAALWRFLRFDPKKLPA